MELWIILCSLNPCFFCYLFITRILQFFHIPMQMEVAFDQVEFNNTENIFPLCEQMTIAFTSLVAIFIMERIDEKKGTASIIPLILAGIISILYWR